MPRNPDKRTRALTFRDDVHRALWGSENWLVSALPSAPSICECEGAPTLDALHPGFPLLVKEIDAAARLSVQVHPNETTARLTGGDPKTEMWCALEDSFVYAGLKDGAGPADIERAIADGTFEDLMAGVPLKAGETLFIPGGMIHAICEGSRIYEVQQPSETTFRLYDWGRTGADGKPRQLHIAQALKAIDYSLHAPRPAARVSCPFFEFDKVALGGERTLSGRDFTILYAFKGDFELFGERCAQGSSVLVEPGDDFTVASANAEIFVTKGSKQ